MAWTNLNSEDVGIKVKGTPAVSSTESLRTRPGRVQTGGTSPMGTPSKLPLPPCPGVLTASICLPYGTDRCSTALIKAAPGGAWAENLGGITTEAPTAASWKRERVDVLIRTDDILRHRVYYTALQPGQPSAGGWEPGSNWNHTSTNKIFSAPAAVAWWSGNALKRIDCFAQDANNNLMHTRWM